MRWQRLDRHQTRPERRFRQFGSLQSHLELPEGYARLEPAHTRAPVAQRPQSAAARNRHMQLAHQQRMGAVTPAARPVPRTLPLPRAALGRPGRLPGPGAAPARSRMLRGGGLPKQAPRRCASRLAAAQTFYRRQQQAAAAAGGLLAPASLVSCHRGWRRAGT